MKYKGEFSPSYLADPVCTFTLSASARIHSSPLQEDFSWHPLSACENALERFRYACFAHPERSLEGQPSSIGIGTCFIQPSLLCFYYPGPPLLKEPPPQIPETILSEICYVDFQEGFPVSVPVTVCFWNLPRAPAHLTLHLR